MGVSPRRAAPPDRPISRTRLRLGALVGGLALLIAGGAALVPEAVARVAPPALSGVNDPQVPGAVAVPAPVAGASRADERPARGSAEDRSAAGPGAVAPAPAAQPLTDLTEVAGIPEPCSVDLVLTDDLSAADITRRAEHQWGVTLTGPQWRQDAYRPVVKLFAETLDSVDCTDYLDRVKAGNRGRLEISSEPTRSWAWGDYGLTRPNVLTLDFAKFQQGYADGDRGRLVRLVIHEMAHSLNADRFSEPAYWSAYQQVWSANGPVSDYGTTATESFADAVGYYVARCAADNPYATADQAPYYEYVKTHVFGGHEFGGPVGVTQHCAIAGR